MGGKIGPIQTRSDFERYPFDEIPHLFWEANKPKLDAIRKVLPTGMKAYGGCGYGIFESAQDLVGYENLCIMQYILPTTVFLLCVFVMCEAIPAIKLVVFLFIWTGVVLFLSGGAFSFRKTKSD